MYSIDEILKNYGPISCELNNMMFIGCSHNNFVVWSLVSNEAQMATYELVTTFPYNNLTGTSCGRVLNTAKKLAEKINNGVIAL